jgi:hypothetical protein
VKQHLGFGVAPAEIGSSIIYFLSKLNWVSYLGNREVKIALGGNIIQTFRLTQEP